MKNTKCILLVILIALFSVASFVKSAFRVIDFQDVSNNPVQSITFTSQGAPPQKSCELVDDDAINGFLNLLKKVPTIRVPFIRGGGGIVRANIIQADGSQHSLQLYTANLAAIDGTGVIIVSPRNFAKQILNYVAICPDSWI